MKASARIDMLARLVARSVGPSRHIGRLTILGLCGAQGSGKSTLAAALRHHLGEAAVLSLDDLYLTRAERNALADDVHPLLRTRGVPGTHDLKLAHSVIERLSEGEAVRLPRFDKASDDRLPESLWPLAPAGTEVLIFEGWCVGARPQPQQDLRVPINDLEREEDSDGSWRRYVNRMLAGPYQQLFDCLDFLVLLAAPNWRIVRTWRIEQEQQLRRESGASMGMSDAEVGRFVQYYERLTRWILDEMPKRADLLVRLSEDRTPLV
jgi:D-glycerate 3-kinase